MSAPGQEDLTDEVKVYLGYKLRIAEKQNHWFDSYQDFFDYLRSIGDLDEHCEEWLDNSTPRGLREFFKSHQDRRQHHASAAQAPSLDLGGPSVRHVGNVPVSDSGIGSPTKDQPMDYPPQDGNFNVLFVPVAEPDVRPRSLKARIDTTRTDNIIDLEMAKELCSDRVEEGDRVMVGYRFEDDLDGTTAKQITCIVGQIEENVIFAKEPPGFPTELRSGYPMDQPKFDEDDPEFKARRGEYLVQMITDAAHVMAKRDMQNKKRGPEDDSGRHHPARRVRTRQ